MDDLKAIFPSVPELKLKHHLDKYNGNLEQAINSLLNSDPENDIIINETDTTDADQVMAQELADREYAEMLQNSEQQSSTRQEAGSSNESCKPRFSLTNVQ